jgi:hypothetical protein
MIMIQRYNFLQLITDWYNRTSTSLRKRLEAIRLFKLECVVVPVTLLLLPGMHSAKHATATTLVFVEDVLCSTKDNWQVPVRARW